LLIFFATLPKFDFVGESLRWNIRFIIISVLSLLFVAPPPYLFLEATACDFRLLHLFVLSLSSTAPVSSDGIVLNSMAFAGPKFAGTRRVPDSFSDDSGIAGLCISLLGVSSNFAVSTLAVPLPAVYIFHASSNLHCRPDRRVQIVVIGLAGRSLTGEGRGVVSSRNISR
jgi:hypothetical protein